MTGSKSYLGKHLLWDITFSLLLLLTPEVDSVLSSRLNGRRTFVGKVGFSKPVRRHERLISILTSRRSIVGFGDPKYFSDRLIPSTTPGTKLKVPNYDVLFGEICKVSPLAKKAFYEDEPGGIDAIDKDADVYKWKVTDSSPNRLISRIEKIDNFQNKGVPLLRFRSTLRGPSKKRGECFAELITTEELRQKWDATNDVVYEIYSGDLKDVKEVQDSKYGEPSLFGIGYVKTKQSVVSPREQLTLCGLQNFPSGASLIWGVELEENQNHLFPNDGGKRVRRSTSHIFATTIIPTEGDEFDVEYVLQLEIGDFPGWLTGPVVAETVKKMFRFADDYFKSGFEDGGALAQRLADMEDDLSIGSDGEEQSDMSNASILGEKESLLMPP